MFNLKSYKEPVSQIQIVRHSTNSWAIVWKVNILKDQIKDEGTLLD